MNLDAEHKQPLPSSNAHGDGDEAVESLPDTLSPHQVKMGLVSDAIETCGMGRYQWRIFFLCGFGYMLDLMWPQMISFLAPRIQVEFGIPASQYGDIFSVQHVGSTVGAAACGVLVDVFGRRFAFNVTVAMISVFGLLIGALDSWTAILAVVFLVGFGLGGNVPIDATILMEFIPKKHRWLLVALSAFQRFGVLAAALISWGLVPTHACPFTTPSASCALVALGEPCCTKQSNYGWRYAFFAIGGISTGAFLARFVLFPFHESPHFLVTYGRYEEAVHVINTMARTNGRVCTLMVEELRACDRQAPADEQPRTGVRGQIHAAGRHIAELFTTWDIARLTIPAFAAYVAYYWSVSISNAFLPKLLAQRGAHAHLSTEETYRQYVLSALPGIPGVVFGAAIAEAPFFGRRWSLVLTAAAMGAALVAFVLVHKPHDSVALNAVEYLFQAAFGAVLFVWTAEAFPARMRGSAAGLAGCAGRIASIVSPLVAARAGAATTGIYLAGGGMFLASLACVLLPETRRRDVI